MNVVLAILYVASIMAAAIGESAYCWFLSVAEIAVLALIVRYAWMWPREAEGTTTRQALRRSVDDYEQSSNVGSKS
jgi:hypothetical protein